MPPVQRNPLYINPIMELVDPVVSALMGDERKRLNKELHSLIQKNEGLGGTKDAYYYAGELFTLLPRKFLRNQSIKPIHKSLQDDAENLRGLIEKLDTDVKRLTQSLSVVLPKCKNRQDVRDVLPESLVVLIPDFDGLDRQKEEGFLLQSNPTLQSQFSRAIKIAQYYTANQLIY